MSQYKTQKTILGYFDFSNIKGDFLGGLTGAIIALPMGLAFGIQSGLGAEAGLYTAIVLAVIAAFVGGTKTLLSDPTGPMTVVAATIVSGALVATNDDLTLAMPIIMATFVLAGIFQIIFGFLGIAKLVKFMPYPVISGFMGGIGIIIIILQLFPLLGHASPKGMINILSNLGTPLADLNTSALLLGSGTIAAIYALPLINKKIPSILIALIGMTAVSLIFPMDVPRIGTIPSGVPPLQIGTLLSLEMQHWSLVLVPAITLAALGTIDTLLTSTVADSLTKTKHNGNKELKGQGLGNLIVALFGGIPGAGATMGTVTNIRAGGRTNLSGIFKGLALLVIVLGLGHYVQFIPMAVLAGILVTIGIGIIDLKGLQLLPKVPKSDAIILIVTLLVTVFDNLLDAVAIGTMISFIMFMKNMSDATLKSNQAGLLGDILQEKGLPEALAKNVYIKHLEGPLFFGFADDFKARIEQINAVEVVVMRLDHVPFMDETGLLVLEEAILLLENKGIEVYLTGLQDKVEERLRIVGIIPQYIHEEEIFKNLDECMVYLAKQYNCKHVTGEIDGLFEAALKNRNTPPETNPSLPMHLIHQ
ncbi:MULTISPECIES: SulP family inorganic anion transporter [unclassified Aureispira]|uniref:SulP family inorganic anion transporter n=1 Tax=unclassified Aureispira TaxID=2649989 RepID=UPI0007C7BC44|nr:MULTISPECIES: SulP family inorganic anion transporter [unclassified Aureispira]WMX14498.1 SulP family inorganic anion transporter [Aureispira sp. CCB-E]